MMMQAHRTVVLRLPLPAPSPASFELAFSRHTSFATQLLLRLPDTVLR